MTTPDTRGSGSNDEVLKAPAGAEVLCLRSEVTPGGTPGEPAGEDVFATEMHRSS